MDKVVDLQGANILTANDILQVICQKYEKMLYGTRLIKGNRHSALKYSETGDNVLHFMENSVETLGNPDNFGSVLRAGWRNETTGETIMLVLPFGVKTLNFSSDL